MKWTYFYDGIYTGHHFSYAKNMVMNTEQSKLIVNKNKVHLFSDIPEDKMRILNCKNPEEYRLTYMGWIVNIVKLLFVQEIFKNRFSFLSADNILTYIFIFSLFKRKDLFITIHHANAVLHLKKYSSIKIRLKRSFEFMCFRMLIKYINGVFVHGQYTEELLRETYKKINICTIHYGIEENQTRNQDLKLRDQTENKRPVILFFGTIFKVKGIEKLAQLTKICTQYDFIIAGKLFDYSEDEIKTLFNGDQHVQLNLRFISEEEVKTYFIQADVLILPYEYYFSGQSGPLTIATIYRVPVVATDVGQMGYDIKKYHLGAVVSDNSPTKLESRIKEVLNKNQDDWGHDGYYHMCLWEKIGKHVDLALHSE